jgi:outer membrane protein assembly factor BamB
MTVVTKNAFYMTRQIFRLLLIVLLINNLSNAWGQHWPGWRGPNGDGSSTEKDLPIEWDSVKNVVWKCKVPGTGHSSPVIWEDKLFITSALSETNEKILLCYDTKTGELLWQQTVVKAALEQKHADNSFASGTPATDGKMVYVSFLDVEDIVVAAYGFDGTKIWEQRPGKFQSPHGYSCSPVIYKDKLIINGISKGDNFFAALSKTDGHIIWKKVQENLSHSFSTPFIRDMSGKLQLILLGNKEIGSYNPDDGSRYWFVNGPSEDFCSTPVYSEKHDLLVVSTAWPRRILTAIHTDGAGDVTDSHVAWQSTDGAMYVPSPVCTDEFLYTTMTNGRVFCTNIATGDTLWTKNMGKQYASPVLADGLVYLPNDEGVMTVLKPGPSFEMVARNDIGEGMIASAAISNGKIYLRGEVHLFCIGNSK